MHIIHPIDFRYGRDSMKAIFSEEEKLRKMLFVETCLAKAEAEAGIIPESAVPLIEKGSKEVKLERVREIENEIHHDLMAVVKALSEVSGEGGKFVHLGATSSDILDNALALQLKDAVKIIKDDLVELETVLAEKTKEHKETVCVGRTHGQHATPTTYGLKFAIWAMEIRRHLDRLEECKKRILVGQMSGAVGTRAGFGPKGDMIASRSLELLGLKPVLVSNQIVQRDRHAEMVLLLALIASTLDKIALEIRNLQRTEIGEVREYVSKKQVGSSTMPQKRNPILGERICGLHRIIKGLAISSFENVPLWHERDLTNSSPERILFTETFVLTDYILSLTIRLLKNMTLEQKNIDKNIALSDGMICAENVMIHLVEKGVGRQDAHELVRVASRESYDTGLPFLDVLEKHLSQYFTRDELKSIVDAKNYIGSAISQVDDVIEALKK